MLGDTSKYEEVYIKNGKLYNHMIKQEQEIIDILKVLLQKGVISNNLIEKLKPHGSKPGVMYRLSKLHKNLVNITKNASHYINYRNSDIQIGTIPCTTFVRVHIHTYINNNSIQHC